MAVLASLTATTTPTAIGWNTNVASIFTPTANYTVTAVEVYLASAQSASMRIGLSTPVTSGSNPSWLNSGTAFVDVASGLVTGWNVITLPASVSLTSGTSYALPIVGGAGAVGGSSSSFVASGLTYTLAGGNKNGVSPIWSGGSTSFYMPFRLDDSSLPAPPPRPAVVRSRAVTRAAVI